MEISFLNSLSLTANIVVFLVLAVIMWFAGTKLAYIVDAVADKTGLTRAFLGLVVLALVTELPELVTTLTASVQGNPKLALNNMFGGIALQTAILAIADLCSKKILSNSPRHANSILEGMILIFALAIILLSSFIGDYSLPFFEHMGLISLLLGILYFFAVTVIRKYGMNKVWRPVDLPEEPEENTLIFQEHKKDFEHRSVNTLILFTCIAGFVILLDGVMLIPCAEAIASKSGLGDSFIGVTLLAGSTSLPELSTTLAAVRINAQAMAIANIFGSNMIMILLLLPADAFYRQGLLLENFDTSSQVAIIVGIVVTSIYCIGLLLRRDTKFIGMGLDSFFVLLIYIASLFILYQLR